MIPLVNLESTIVVIATIMLVVFVLLILIPLLTKVSKLEKQLGYYKGKTKELEELTGRVHLSSVLHPLSTYIVIPRNLLEDCPVEYQSMVASAILHIKQNKADYEEDGYYFAKKVDKNTRRFIVDKFIPKKHNRNDNQDKGSISTKSAK